MLMMSPPSRAPACAPFDSPERSPEPDTAGRSEGDGGAASTPGGLPELPEMSLEEGEEEEPPKISPVGRSAAEELWMRIWDEPEWEVSQEHGRRESVMEWAEAPQPAQEALGDGAHALLEANTDFETAASADMASAALERRGDPRDASFEQALDAERERAAVAEDALRWECERHSAVEGFWRQQVLELSKIEERLRQHGERLEADYDAKKKALFLENELKMQQREAWVIEAEERLAKARRRARARRLREKRAKAARKPFPFRIIAVFLALLAAAAAWYSAMGPQHEALALVDVASGTGVIARVQNLASSTSAPAAYPCAALCPKPAGGAAGAAAGDGTAGDADHKATLPIIVGVALGVVTFFS